MPSIVSAIVPARNAAHFLPLCLRSLNAADPGPKEVWLFEDASEDETAQVAQDWNARVIRNPGPPLGPGQARNRLAKLVQADLLLFVDADVAIHKDALGRLVAAMAEEGVVAAFGSYDDQPSAPGIASRYANLRHHFIHQQSPTYARTFWAGLGMVRRDAFMAVGGFSAAYGRPSIEDIELGDRLAAKGGRIRVVPEAMGTHLKQWSLRQLWLTDMLQRALPWSLLITDGRSSNDGLNGSQRERAAAVLANVTLVLALASLRWHWLLVGCLGSIAAYLYVNRRFFAFLGKRMRPAELMAAVALHFLYHIYASQIFGWTLLVQRIRGWVR